MSASTRTYLTLLIHFRMGPDTVTSGRLAVMPVLRVAACNEFGQILEVLATDPASKPDFAAWSKMTGHKLLSTDEQPGPPKVFRFMIQRTK